MSEAETTWEGYSDYKSVSRQVVQSVDKAIHAYAMVESLHSERAKIRDQQAAEAKAHLLAAGLRLSPELETDRESKDLYDEILKRWETPDDVDASRASADDLGYIRRLNKVELRNECPEWLHQFAVDIRRAAWELGYLQAGRTVSERDEDIVERESDQLFA